MMSHAVSRLRTERLQTVKGVGGGPIKYWLEEVGGKGAAMQMSSNLPGKVGEPSLRVINQKVVLKPVS